MQWGSLAGGLPDTVHALSSWPRPWGSWSICSDPHHKAVQFAILLPQKHQPNDLCFLSPLQARLREMQFQFNFHLPNWRGHQSPLNDKSHAPGKWIYHLCCCFSLLIGLFCTWPPYLVTLHMCDHTIQKENWTEKQAPFPYLHTAPCVCEWINTANNGLKGRAEMLRDRKHQWAQLVYKGKFYFPL